MVVAFCLVYDRKILTLWSKGSLAERRIGHVIETALTASGCAVAHSVYEIDGTVGDIDHLVATPGRIWVVETKYARVPPKRFPEVLSKITRNAKAVREWLSPCELEVVGCLALASIDNKKLESMQRSYEDGGVQVFNPDTLYKEIAKASRLTSGESSKLVTDRVWGLSGVVVSED